MNIFYIVRAFTDELLNKELPGVKVSAIYSNKNGKWSGYYTSNTESDGTGSCIQIPCKLAESVHKVYVTGDRLFNESS